MPQHVVDLPGLFGLHEGQGPPRRALHHQPHLRHLRRQPRDLFVLRAEHGLRRTAPTPGRMADQSGRSRGIHVRPQHLPGEPGRGRLLREDGRRDQSQCAGQSRENRRPARRHARPPHGRRHHACAQPVHRGVLPGSTAGQQADPRDVLPHGRSPRPPVDAVPGRSRHGGDRPVDDRLHDATHALHRVHEEGRADARRSVRLLLRGPARIRTGGPAPHPARLLGLVPEPRGVQFRLPGHGTLG